VDVRSSTRSRRWVLPALVVLLWLVVGGPLSSFAGQLASVQENDNAAFLPESAESTVAFDDFVEFTGAENLPATSSSRGKGASPTETVMPWPGTSRT